MSIGTSRLGIALLSILYIYNGAVHCQQQTAAAPSNGTSIYGAAWQAGGSTDTELTLRDLDQTRPVTVQLNLYNSDGSIAAQEPLVLQPSGRSIVMLSALLKGTQGRGGFSVTWSDPTIKVVGSYVLEDPSIATTISRDMVSSYISDVAMELGTAWYLPDQSYKGVLTLFNSSEQPAQITVTSTGPAETNSNSLSIPLAANSSTVVPVRNIVGADTEGAGTLAIQYSGTLHSIIPALTIYSSSGFVLMPQFFGISSVQPTTSLSFLFPQVGSTELGGGSDSSDRVELLLANPSDSPIAPTGLAFVFDSNGHKNNAIALALPTLNPHSAHVVDILSNLGDMSSTDRLLSLSLSAPTNLTNLAAEVFTMNGITGADAQSVGELAWTSSAVAPWSTRLHVNETVSISGNQSLNDGPALLYVDGNHLQTYRLASTETTGTPLAISLAQEAASRTPDANGILLPQAVQQGLLFPSSVSSARLLYPRACRTACAQNAAAGSPSGATVSQALAEPMEGGGCPSAIYITQNNISQTTAVGKPQSGTFGYDTTNIQGGTIATFTTTDTSQNPNYATIGNTANSGQPEQGGMALLSANFTCSATGTTSPTNTWYVATFGTSCYDLALQSDWYTKTGGCMQMRYKGTMYTGTITNPSGFPSGTYCASFVQDTAVQGTGQLSNGTYVHFTGTRSPKPDCPNTNCTFTVVSTPTDADGATLIPGTTVARDRHIIPKSESLELAPNTPGPGTVYAPTDTGGSGSISGYRIDIYEGYGKASCKGFSNDVRVGSCTPETYSCPQWISTP